MGPLMGHPANSFLCRGAGFDVLDNRIRPARPPERESHHGSPAFGCSFLPSRLTGQHCNGARK